MKQKIFGVLITLVIGILPLCSFIKIKVALYYLIALICIILLLLKRKELKIDDKDTLLIGFLSLAVISTIFSVNSYQSIFGSDRRYEGLLMIIVYCLLYYVSKYHLEYNKNIIKIALITSSIISLYAVMQFYDFMPIHKMFNIEYRKYFSSGTLINRNFMGSYVTIFLPIAMSLYLFKGKKTNLFLVLTLFTALLCTLTRSAWVAFPIYCLIGLIYVIKQKNKQYYTRLFIMLICFILIFIVLNFTQNNKVVGRYNSLKEEVSTIYEDGISNSSGSGRGVIWIFCINATFASPIFGGGVDCVKNILFKHMPYDLINHAQKHNAVIDKAHSEPLQIAITMGIPAMIIYILFISSILEKDIKKIFKNKLSLVFSICIIGYFVQGLFNISVIQVAPIFWVLLGISENTKFRDNIKI